MNDTGLPKGGGTNSAASWLLTMGILWGVGVWRGWWPLGLKSAALAVLIAFAARFLARWFVRAIARSAAPPPTADTVRAEIERLSRNQQPRQLRHLSYLVAADWPNQRGDDAPWTGVKFFIDPLGLILRIGVSAILDEENRTPALVQAFAKNHYENELGMRVVRNEIATFAGHWCVVTDAVHPNGGAVRRYSFSLHLSEYCVQFTFITEAHFTACQALMDSVVGLCHLTMPRLVDCTVLGGTVIIGVPQDWTQTTDETRAAAWQAFPGPLEVRLDLLGEAGQVRIDETVFQRVPNFELPAGCLFRKIRMDENGVSGLRLVWSPPAMRSFTELVADAVRLPSGQVVVLTTRNRGQGEKKMQGFNVDTMRLELLASLRPADAPVL